MKITTHWQFPLVGNPYQPCCGIIDLILTHCYEHLGVEINIRSIGPGSLNGQVSTRISLEINGLPLEFNFGGSWEERDKALTDALRTHIGILKKDSESESGRDLRSGLVLCGTCA